MSTSTSRTILASSLLLAVLVAAPPASGFSVRWLSDRGGDGESLSEDVYPAPAAADLLQGHRPSTASSTSLDAMAEAKRLLKKLQRLDPQIDAYVNQVLHQKSASDIDARQETSREDLRQGQRIQTLWPSATVHNSQLGRLPEVPSEFSDILPTIKRQSSSGAQICIWKVCPPSPWRRNGRPHIG